MKVWVLQGVNGVDATAPVKFQEFFEQADCEGALVAEFLFKSPFTVWPFPDAFAARKFAPSGHVVVVG